MPESKLKFANFVDFYDGSKIVIISANFFKNFVKVTFFYFIYTTPRYIIIKRSQHAGAYSFGFFLLLLLLLPFYAFANLVILRP